MQGNDPIPEPVVEASPPFRYTPVGLDFVADKVWEDDGGADG